MLSQRSLKTINVAYTLRTIGVAYRLKFCLKALGRIHVGSGLLNLSYITRMKLEDIQWIRSQRKVRLKIIEEGVKQPELKESRSYEKITQSTPIIPTQFTPIIPGSTLKGLVRQRIHHAISSKQKPNIEHLIRNIAKSRKSWRHVVLYGNWNPDEKKEEVEKLFGSTSMQSRVYFSDAVPVTEPITIVYWSGRAYHTEPPSMGKAFRFNYVAIEEGTEFEFHMTCLNTSIYELGLLLRALNLNPSNPCEYSDKHYILIGRMKYRKNLAGKPVGKCSVKLVAGAKYVKLKEEEIKDLAGFAKEAISQSREHFADNRVRFADNRVLEKLPEEYHGQTQGDWKKVLNAVISGSYPY